MAGVYTRICENVRSCIGLYEKPPRPTTAFTVQGAVRPTCVPPGRYGSRIYACGLIRPTYSETCACRPRSSCPPSCRSKARVSSHAGTGDGMADDAGAQHAGAPRSEPGAGVELGAGDEGAAVGGKGHFKGVVEGVEIGFDGGSTVSFWLPSRCRLHLFVIFGPTYTT